MTKVKVSQSSLHGQGLITNQSIRCGEIALHIRGEILELSIFFKLPKKVKDNTYRYSQNEYLTPQGEYGDFLNHSCIPNSKVVKRAGKLYLVTIEDIKKDAEVTIDYSTILAKDDNWAMKCKCGSESCRVKIKRYDTLPKPLFEYYLMQGLIPPYILSIK